MAVIEAKASYRSDTKSTGLEPQLLTTGDSKLNKRRLKSWQMAGSIIMTFIGIVFQKGLTGSMWEHFHFYTDSLLTVFENELGAQPPLDFS